MSTSSGGNIRLLDEESVGRGNLSASEVGPGSCAAGIVSAAAGNCSST